eukprot:g63341.t1
MYAASCIRKKRRPQQKHKQGACMRLPVTCVDSSVMPRHLFAVDSPMNTMGMLYLARYAWTLVASVDFRMARTSLSVKERIRTF